MEEKVLVKGEFGGKFFAVLLWILSMALIAICIVCGIVNYDEELIIMGIVGGIPLIILSIILSVILKKA